MSIHHTFGISFVIAASLLTVVTSLLG